MTSQQMLQYMIEQKKREQDPNYRSTGDKLRGLTDESQSAKDKRNALNETGLASNEFAEYGQGGYQAMTAEAQKSRDYLRRLASGEDSLSREQLRQGLAQNMSAQRSMAASASPANAPMAALHAAQNMGRMGMGMSGQAAIAGIQERQGAQSTLANMIMQQRQQDAQVALGSRANANNAYSGVTPEQSALEKATPYVNAGAGLFSVIMNNRNRDKGK